MQVKAEKKASKGQLVVKLATSAALLWSAPQKSVKKADLAALMDAVRAAVGGAAVKPLSKRGKACKSGTAKSKRSSSSTDESALLASLMAAGTGKMRGGKPPGKKKD